MPIPAFALIMGRRQLAGSAIGGIRERKRCWIFALKKASRPISELIRIQQINEAYERLLKGDVKYPCVIDMASLK